MLNSRSVSRRRGSGTVLPGRTNNLALRRDCGVSGENGGFTEAGKAFFATGFARTFNRLDDQEAGYTEFVGFLVRVLDQMP